MSRTVRTIIEDRVPLTAPGEMTVGEAARLMTLNRVGAVMVVENGKLVGIFTERDALTKVTAVCLDAESTPVAKVMTRDPECIEPDKPFVDAFRIMHEHGFRHVPVVENGWPIGMVSSRDALGPEVETFIHQLLR
jgi:CBS domain-containing protein